jgi:DHA1 family tetracycline resistance protein-like MFS transporter
VSQAGTAISFLVLGLSSHFWVMLLARALDGASGGNILVAQAYVADVTKPEERARGMGLIGMAFGLGFVLGPLLGGFLLELPLPAAWHLRLPFLVAAGFSTLAWFLVWTRLPESLPRGTAPREAARVLSLRGLVDTARLPGVAPLVLVGFLVVFAFASFEGTFALFLRRRFGWNASSAAYAFAALGFLSALVQGGLIRVVVPRVGELRLIAGGIALVTMAFLFLAASTNVAWLGIALVLFGFGQGFFTPSLSGLLSRITPWEEQGAVFGVLSSSQTLARMISYSVANILLGRVSLAAPYWTAATVDLLALIVATSLWNESRRGRFDASLPIAKVLSATHHDLD